MAGNSVQITQQMAIPLCYVFVLRDVLPRDKRISLFKMVLLLHVLPIISMLHNSVAS